MWVGFNGECNLRQWKKAKLENAIGATGANANAIGANPLWSRQPVYESIIPDRPAPINTLFLSHSWTKMHQKQVHLTVVKIYCPWPDKGSKDFAVSTVCCWAVFIIGHFYYLIVQLSIVWGPFGATVPHPATSVVFHFFKTILEIICHSSTLQHVWATCATCWQSL